MLKRLIDEEYTRHPFYGSRKMVVYLGRCGHGVNRKRAQRLMRSMGLAGMAPGPNTSWAHPQHKVYPYLLRGVPVDTSVWQPERLDFVGGAVCQSPLEQRHMSCDLLKGGQDTLDVRSAPKIGRAQEDKIRKIEQRARDAVESERIRIRAVWVERRVGELVQRGAQPDEARQSVQQAAEMHTLNGAFVITLENGTDVVVAELLADPSKYHGQRCHDPLEPEYHGDPRVAFISLNNGGRPYIFSHAHGGWLPMSPLQMRRLKRSQSAEVESKLQYPYLGTGVRSHPSSRLIGVACSLSDDGDR